MITERPALVKTIEAADLAPSTHHTQYFEMMGVRGLYHDGWMLSTVPIRPPWQLLGTTILDPANAYEWELYDLQKDWTQNDNVAASNPAKLKEMQQLLWVELAKYREPAERPRNPCPR